jgi:hypothetical protein
MAGRRDSRRPGGFRTYSAPMRTPLVLLSSFVAALLLGACGGPEAGESCNTTGFACQDERTALECASKTWRAIPCRGANGCDVAVGKVTCDVTRNQAGDACASVNEGQGICDPTGTATLECRGGAFQQTNTCTSCQVSGDQVICSQ